MKTYHENHIRKAEIAQLIILQQVYSMKESRSLIFQGGTALRWCYGGSRFSEDLDFVTPLAPDAVNNILQAAVKGVGKLMVPHFGAGSIALVPKKARTGSWKCFVDFQPQDTREKIAVKLEFEGLTEGNLPDVQNYILAALSPVAYLVAAGEFRVPRPNAVVVAQTAAEILSDKIRALLERPYLKGRDFFDLWYLHSVLKTPVDVKIIERKFTLYRAAFKPIRPVIFFARPSKQNKALMREAIEQDLARFLPPEIFDVHRADNHAGFLEAVSSVFSDIQAKGVRLP